MNSQIQTQPSPGTGGGDAGANRRAVRQRILQVVGQYLFMAAVLFIGAGRLDWLWAWVFLGVGLAILFVNLRVVPPELIAERGRSRPEAKRWDQILTSITSVSGLVMLPLIGLDERFGWSPTVAVGVHIGALALYAAGMGLFSWAMASNVYFARLVSIQMERDHTVASSGPYHIVRHPGYTGFILFSLATPVALGSLWALIPAAVTSVLFIVRTALEDETLKQELDGYQAYAQRVRHRLVPGIW